MEFLIASKKKKISEYLEGKKRTPDFSFKNNAVLYIILVLLVFAVQGFLLEIDTYFGKY